MGSSKLKFVADVDEHLELCAVYMWNLNVVLFIFFCFVSNIHFLQIYVVVIGTFIKAHTIGVKLKGNINSPGTCLKEKQAAASQSVCFFHSCFTVLSASFRRSFRAMNELWKEHAVSVLFHSPFKTVSVWFQFRFNCTCALKVTAAGEIAVCWIVAFWKLSSL